MGLLDAWRFCPACAAKVEVEDGRAKCAACGFVRYANSAPTANALCTDELGRVLLGRRAVEPDKGLWDIPGGFLEEGEHPLDGIRRELREETGLEVEPGELFGMWMQPHAERTVLCILWLATVLGGVQAAADDIVELGWFAPDELPEDIGPSAFMEAVSLWRGRHEHA